MTRPAGGDDPLVGLLESAGYAVLAVPTVTIRAKEFDWPDTEAYDWAVVTSVAAVSAMGDVPTKMRWGAVGQATADALQKRGIEVDLVPESRTDGAALADAIPDVAGARIIFLRGTLAGGDVADGLRRRGATVDELTVYDTVEGPEESRAPLQRALSRADLAAVVFASGSAIRGFLRLGGTALVPAITIGPRTTATAREHGFHVTAEAADQNVDNLFQAVTRSVPVEVPRDA